MRNPSEIKARLRQLRQKAYEAVEQDWKNELLNHIAELEWVLEPTEWEADKPAPPVNKPTRELFEVIRNPRAPVALVSAYFEDKPTTVIALMREEDDGTQVIQPLFFEATSHVIDRLRGPDGKPPEPLDNNT